MALYDALEDLDDSQNVYSNFDISDEILEQLDQNKSGAVENILQQLIFLRSIYDRNL